MTGFPLRFEQFFLPMPISDNKHKHKLVFHHISEAKKKDKVKYQGNKYGNVQTRTLVFPLIQNHSPADNSFLLNQFQSEFAKITRGRCCTFTHYMASWTAYKKTDLQI